MNAVTPQPLHRSLGLTDGELARIQELLERDPNDFELAVFSLLWSEHCGYKHSRLLLKRLPSEGAAVLQGPGENAGVIAAGDGLGVALKVESHNHPSAVEPFQGAATGVGGILRDIFAMGARPIAILDSLRFGELDADGQKRLFQGVVDGVGHYGNCVGVANVGGEVVFDEPYQHNCLVNAMCVGVLPVERIQSAAAAGAGNLVVLYGARTGRDGIGGASVLASQGFDESSGAKRPVGADRRSVHRQEADRVHARAAGRRPGRVAAGSGRRRAWPRPPPRWRPPVAFGLDIDLGRVPLREADMEPFEIMISESQERMAAIVAPDRWPEVEALCAHWDLDATVIGEVTDRGRLRAFHHGVEVGDIPVSALVEDCPRYPLAPSGPPGCATSRSTRPHRRPTPARRCGRFWLAQYRQPPLDHASVRPAGRVGHRHPPRRRRRRRAPDPVAPRDRDRARR